MAKRIIVIDNEKGELADTCKSLLELKYIASTLNAGNFKIAELIALDPALVLVYIDSSSDKGHDLLLDIRANFFTTRLPVILITNHSDSGKAFKDDAKVFCFVKPFDQRKLIDQVNELLLAKIIPLYQIVGGGMFPI